MNIKVNYISLYINEIKKTLYNKKILISIKKN